MNFKWSLAHFFRFKHYQTTYRQEIIAGFTSYLAVVYIVIVNPWFLEAAGMDRSAAFSATIFAVVAGSLVTAFFANVPFVMAPGMGLNAIFTYELVGRMGFSWQAGLGIIFLSGCFFFILALFSWQKRMMVFFPSILLVAILGGLGTLLVILGLSNLGLVRYQPPSLELIWDQILTWNSLLGFFGLFLVYYLYRQRIAASFLIACFVVTLASYALGLVQTPSSFSWTDLVSSPPSLAPTFLHLEFSSLWTLASIVPIFTFMFIDLFDSVGSLAALVPELKRAEGSKEKEEAFSKTITADAVATILGACFGTQSTTVYLESSSGVLAGGRTGFTALVVSVMFLLTLFLFPLVELIPPIATAPMMLFIGLLMLSRLKTLHRAPLGHILLVLIVVVSIPLLGIGHGIALGLFIYYPFSWVSSTRRDAFVGEFILFLASALFLLAQHVSLLK